MKLWCTLASVYALFFGSTGHAESLQYEFDGYLSTELGYSTSSLTHVLSREEAGVSVKGRKDSCKGSAALRFRNEGNLRRNSDLSAGHFWALDLREAQIECRQKDWSIGFGRQSVVWGKADGIPLLDAIHSFDYSEYLLGEREQARRPLTMLRIERQLDSDGYLQALVIPEHRRDFIPGANDRFAGPWGPHAGLLDTTRDTSRLKFPHQFGLQWEQFTNDASWTLNFLRRTAPQPYFSLDPQSFSPVATDYTQTMVGGSVDRPYKEWVGRAELAYFDRLFLPVDANSVDYRRYRQIGLMLGVDRPVKDWLFGAQIFQNTLHGQNKAPIGGRERHTLTLMATRSFWQDRIKLRSFLAQDLDDAGTWFSTRISWEVRPDSSLEFQLDEMFGGNASPFGLIDSESRGTLRLKTNF